jgi:hypothetical protein
VLPVGLAEPLQALSASGLVGQLQLTALPWDGGEREVRLLARTHAGSATERATWRRALASAAARLASRRGLGTGQATPAEPHGRSRCGR